MDPLTFIAQIVKALAWPVTVLVLVLFLRRPLRGLIPLLTRLKYKDLELEFGRKLDEIRERVALELPEPAPQALPPTPRDPLEKLAEISPRAAVLEAWRKLERVALERAKRRVAAAGGDPTKVRPHEVVQQLQCGEGLDPGAAKVLPVLRELRNRAAHAPEFALSSESALNFASIAARIARELEG